jgi:hypothetical protein
MTRRSSWSARGLPPLWIRRYSSRDAPPELTLTWDRTRLTTLSLHFADVGGIFCNPQMFTSTENRPLVSKVFAMISLAVGIGATAMVVASFVFTIFATRASNPSGLVLLSVLGSFLAALVGTPSGLYAAFLGRRALGLTGAALSFVSYPLSTVALDLVRPG